MFRTLITLSINYYKILFIDNIDKLRYSDLYVSFW